MGFDSEWQPEAQQVSLPNRLSNPPRDLGLFKFGFRIRDYFRIANGNQMGPVGPRVQPSPPPSSGLISRWRLWSSTREEVSVTFPAGLHQRGAGRVQPSCINFVTFRSIHPPARCLIGSRARLSCPYVAPHDFGKPSRFSPLQH